MTDENANTADLTPNEKLDQVLRKLGDLDARLAALESQGTNTTRPLLDQIIKETVQTRETLTERMDGMDARLERIEKQLEVMTLDVMRVRADQRRLEDRIDDVERRPN
jgi:chromosome segregation ATPase